VLAVKAFPDCPAFGTLTVINCEQAWESRRHTSCFPKSGKKYAGGSFRHTELFSNINQGGRLICNVPEDVQSRFIAMGKSATNDGYYFNHSE